MLKPEVVTIADGLIEERVQQMPTFIILRVLSLQANIGVTCSGSSAFSSGRQSMSLI